MSRRLPSSPHVADSTAPANVDLLSTDHGAIIHDSPADAVTRYRAIFAHSTEAIAIIDTEGRYLEQNLAHQRLLGYSADELRGRTPAIHVGEDSFSEIAQLLASTGQCRREIRSRTRDGRLLDLELSAFAVLDRSGSPLCYIGIKRDITEERRDRAELARRYERLEAMYRMTDAVARAPAIDDVYEEALEALERTLGVDRAAVLLFDTDGVMRFKAWRGLSDGYRAAVEGHSPWSPDDVDPAPVIVPDVDLEPSLAAFLPVFAADGIRALAFYPLVTDGRLLGKFMLYFSTPHATDEDETRLTRTIASHIAVAIARRRGELALRESEEKYRRLVEVCPLGVLVHSDERIVFANPVAVQLLGAQSTEELLERPILDVVHSDYHAVFRERGRQLSGGTPDAPAVEKRFVRIDGVPVDVEVAKIGFTYRGRPAVQVVMRDITERKRAEEAHRLLVEAGTTLAASLDDATTLQSIAKLAVPAIADWCVVDLLIDESGAFRRVAVAHADPADAHLARALQREYAASSDEVAGVSRALRTGRAECFPDLTDPVLIGSARDEDHLRVMRQMGLVSSMVTPLIAHDRVLGAITFASSGSGRRYGPADLTLAEELARRAALAVDNARLYREAREANRVKSQFLATMSHELRTPLNAIAGYAELLELGVHGPLTEEQREDLRRIRVNQRHLLGLINDVLSFTRLETGRLEFAIADVPVEEILAAARAHIEPQIAARELRYELRSGDPRVACRCDRDKLQQVVLNLLANAVKFTPPGGCVTLSWDATPDRVAIHVTDTGRGIPRDKLELIFEPFVQVDTGFSARYDGAGLGLAISRELARAMDGEVSVQSSVGEGSTFTVVLPRGENKADGEVVSRQ